MNYFIKLTTCVCLLSFNLFSIHCENIKKLDGVLNGVEWKANLLSLDTLFSFKNISVNDENTIVELYEYSGDKNKEWEDRYLESQIILINKKAFKKKMGDNVCTMALKTKNLKNWFLVFNNLKLKNENKLKFQKISLEDLCISTKHGKN